MNIVARPHLRPFRCAVTGRAEDAEGFVDTNNLLRHIWAPIGPVAGDDDPHVYVCVAALRDMGRLIGLEDPTELRERIVELERELHDRDLQLREADKLVDAIDTFESAGFRARKKPGRPPSKQAA